MLNYAICEIGGKQYKVLPNVPFEVDYQGENIKDLKVNVQVLADNGKLKLGDPYIKEKLSLKFLENTKGKKIRVAKYHAKANYRRIKGIRPKHSKLVWSVKKTS